MFKKLGQLTNIRPKNDDVEFILSPTKGICRISPNVGLLLNVTANDFLSLLTAEVEIDGKIVERTFLFKGSEKTETAPQVGSKLAFTNGKGGVLQMSSGNVWNELGGDTNFNTIFKVHGNEEGDKKPIEDEGVLYFMLEYKAQIAKSEKSEDDAPAKAADLGGSND